MNLKQYSIFLLDLVYIADISENIYLNYFCPKENVLYFIPQLHSALFMYVSLTHCSEKHLGNREEICCLRLMWIKTPLSLTVPKLFFFTHLSPSICLFSPLHLIWLLCLTYSLNRCSIKGIVHPKFYILLTFLLFIIHRLLKLYSSSFITRNICLYQKQL